MSNPEVNPIGGIWPLGKMTITHGTPVSILVNVGAQVAGQSDAGVPQVMPGGRKFNSMVTQIIFSAPTSNTADVFVQDGNVAGPDVNRTVLCVPKGTTLALPMGTETQSGNIDPSRYYVDGTTSDVIYVSCAGAN
jgi:hypothetical protein